MDLLDAEGTQQRLRDGQQRPDTRMGRLPCAGGEPDRAGGIERDGFDGGVVMVIADDPVLFFPPPNQNCT